MRTDLPHLFGMLPDDLAAYLRSIGVDVRDSEARRIQSHVVSHGRPGLPSERPPPKRVLQAVETSTRREPLEVVHRVEDPRDAGFVKYLLRSPDGCLSEAVRIPLEKDGAYSVCLSSQVGCAMGCAFCATGRLGFTRDLETWEMVSAFVRVREDCPGRLSGAVFMGQGEPLLNYDAVVKAARILSDPCGGRVKAELISISTVGIVPAIRRYAAEGHRYRLIVSLTSTDAARRASLLPVASRWSPAEVVDAIRAYAAVARNRVTVAWVLVGGVNSGSDEVDGIRRLLGDLPLRLNVIDVNDPRPDGFRQATPDELLAFRQAVCDLGIPVVRRYSGGTSTHAACGMLASRGLEGAPP
jgi:23S rRNA (adenine2503-C2)-methyltransferase